MTALLHPPSKSSARSWLRMAFAGAVAAGLFGMTAPAFAQGVSGTTLAAYKTIDICAIDATTWKYSGEVSVWNQGAVPTTGLKILDYIQKKASGPTWTTAFGPLDIGGGAVIPPGTTQLTALTFPYSFQGGGC